MMDKNKDINLIVLVILAVIAILVVGVSFIHPKHNSGTEATRISDTVFIHDTIREVAPVAHDSIYIRKEVARLKVSDVGKTTTSDTGKNCTHVVFRENFRENSRENRTIVENATVAQQSLFDSVDVEIPIMQKIYATKQYKAWISGYHPNLDSIEVYQDTKVITNTVTIRQKPKRWGVGVQGGYGAGKNGMQPYIGIGISYNILRW